MLDYSCKKFNTCILQAKDECNHPSHEEGGIIMERSAEYLFLKITNKHRDTDTAISLYEADKVEMGRKVFEKIREGWKIHSSFHTHPLFSAEPSILDHNTLFQGFKLNVIYSPLKEMFSETAWEENEAVTYYISKKTVELIVNTQ